MKQLRKSNPDAWWWLKADGCDITKGLKESVKLQWSGDVDLNDGSLQKQCDAYNKRLKMAENAGLDRNQAGEDFKNILKDLAEDLNFLNAELIRSNDVYSEKLHSNKYNDKDLINLSWKLKELGDLNEMGRKLHSDIDVLSAKIGEHQHSWQQDNIPSQLKEIRTNLVAFIRGITRHQRTAATHILVFMISNEERRKKPYAIPVQYLPYKGLTDGRVRKLSNKLIEEMTKRKMKVAGFTTDGEWNSLRMKGNTRPLSVLQIRSDVRRQYGHMKLQKMIEMITPVCDADGQCTARAYNPAVPADLLKQVHGWFKTGATTDDAIDRLRLQTVPAGYTFHTWIEGKDETKAEKLKSILAQLEYKHQVDLWQSKGVPFKEHLYVPEIHPKTGLGFCEREDEGHILKRIGNSLRQGGNDDIQLERFEEALHDSSAGLTYTALSGVRKQSVEDVERLFSGSLVKWMENKGYKKEAEYLSVVHNWRRACEWRHEYITKHNLPPEHPRASTTDDVECFFSLLRDSVGKDFTLKEVLYGWRRVTHEFVKRIDPDLPFYYYTSAHSRFYEGEMPDFEARPNKNPKPKRAPKYEMLESNNRVTLAVRNSTSIRATFHNLPVELPPPPGTYNQLTHEHSYTNCHK